MKRTSTLTLARLRNVLWGGDPLLPQQVARALDAAGFADVRILSRPGPRWCRLREVAHGLNFQGKESDRDDHPAN